MRTLKFTVDSRLLRELGERLVGRPHIALAELVKNSYDADASQVVIRFAGDRIEVTDDGHGMSPEEFEDKWLRIGSTHKEREAYSPKLRRPLTGSKGVGRLSVQLLANRLEIHSVSSYLKKTELIANVDWREAVEAGDLTEAPVHVDEVPSASLFAQDSPIGTKLVLTDLNHTWGPAEFEDLARELWPLQPPFEDTAQKKSSFRIILDSPYRSYVRAFDGQMRAMLDLWYARLTGELLAVGATAPSGTIDVRRINLRARGTDTESWDTPSDFDSEDLAKPTPTRIVRLKLEFSDGNAQEVNYRLSNCQIDQLDFEIRVYSLRHRQPRGIGVSEARAYLRRFGGVHLYDTGFHLPYYGPDTDWLHIEIDHSHRLSRSRLLPEQLQLPGGMSNLPTNTRLFGVVNVNTAHEQRNAKQLYGDARNALAIQVSRDRLTDTLGYRDLVILVRWALDYYALEVAQRAAEKSRKNLTRGERATSRLGRLQHTLDNVKEDIPGDTFEEISMEVDQILREAEADERRYESYLGLLGALATGGISALAYEHEVSKQFEALDDIALTLYDAAESVEADVVDLGAIAQTLEAWVERARSTHNLFSHLLQEENRTVRDRFNAKATISLVWDQVSAINPGVTLNADGVSAEVRLPLGRYVEWSAIFQNIFTNAFNAMREKPRRQIDINSTHDRGTTSIVVQDTGIGVDVANSQSLFDPFVRRLKPGPDHIALALGGSGLGLTIVRMMAEELRCRVEFVVPDASHTTAFRISWRD